ncbi:MAG: hypothetical protein EOP54_16700, partial [Sphingobacteriales bacterium]
MKASLRANRSLAATFFSSALKKTTPAGRYHHLILVLLFGLMGSMPFRVFAQDPEINYAENPYMLVTGEAISYTPSGNNLPPFHYNTEREFVGAGMPLATCVAVDNSGTIYVGRGGQPNIKKIRVGGIESEITTGFEEAVTFAVDRSGNLYAVEVGGDDILKYTNGAGSPATITSTGVSQIMALALDAAGNIYVSSQLNGGIYRIPAGGGTAVRLGADDFAATALAIDNDGTIYAAATASNLVYKIAADGSTSSTVGTGFNNPTGLTIDAGGNVYVVNRSSSTIKMIPAYNTATTVDLVTGIAFMRSLALDGAGNIFVTSDNETSIIKITPDGGFFSPMLPAGLRLNNETGELYGTPTKPAPETTYPVTVYNLYGSMVFDLVIRVQSNDATLSALTISAGTLSPVFNSATNDYTVTVPNSVSTINITPTVSQPSAAITMNSTAIASGTGRDFALDEGDNSISIEVTAENGATNQYTILITRQSLPTVDYYDSPYQLVTGESLNTNLTSDNVAPFGYSTEREVVGSGLSSAATVAVDPSGNVYVGRVGQSAIKKISTGGVVSELATSFGGTANVATDASGNLYAVEMYGDVILKYTNGTGSPATITSTGVTQIMALALDGSGNIYASSQTDGGIYKIPAGGGTAVKLGTGNYAAMALAIDADGTIYAAGTASNVVYKIAADGSTSTTIGTGFSSPYGIKIDAGGNVFVTDRANNAIKMIPASNTSTTVTLASGLTLMRGIALDAAGNIFVTGDNETSIVKIRPVGGYFSPILPAGLRLDNESGVISGTATTSTPSTDYLVTAYNAGGSGSSTVTIHVRSNNADLSALAVNAGALSPAFSAGTTDYTVTVVNAVTSIKITPTVSQAGAKVSVDNNEIASGSGYDVSLSDGDNSITVQVTAEDETTKDYYLTVTRLELPTFDYNQSAYEFTAGVA